jgi:transposase
MTRKIYRVKLTEEERLELKGYVSKGRVAAHKQIHARILLLSDDNSTDGSKKDTEIVDALGTSLRTVERVRQRFAEEGLERAINPKPKTRYRSKKLDGAGEGFLVATACSKAPEGRADWTLQLLADRLVECNITDSISIETIRQTLKKTNLNRG